MANGIYGIKRPADFLPQDAAVFYTYKATRSDNNTSVFSLDSNLVIQRLNNPNQLNYPLGGLYDLTLPTAQFSALGYYTVYVRPREINAVIRDCGVLSNRTDVRGIIIDLATIPSDLRANFENGGLVGYVVEYRNDNNASPKLRNFFRIITSNFRVEPIADNSSTSSQKSIRYRYSDSPTNLIFLTVTPSSSPTTRPNIIPFIGQPNQNIILTNSHFNPTTIEIEMVEHDISTLALALYGNQSKATSSGIYTIYDGGNNIYKQFNLYEVKDEFNETLYEIREQRTDIDQTLNFDDITE
jgi:hypothetical protein